MPTIKISDSRMTQLVEAAARWRKNGHDDRGIGLHREAAQIDAQGVADWILSDWLDDPALDHDRDPSAPPPEIDDSLPF